MLGFLWPGVISVDYEEGTVLQDVCWGSFGQVLFLWAVRRGQFCRMCAESLWPGVVSVGCEEWTVLQDEVCFLLARSGFSEL